MQRLLYVIKPTMYPRVARDSKCRQRTLNRWTMGKTCLDHEALFPGDYVSGNYQECCWPRREPEQQEESNLPLREKHKRIVSPLTQLHTPLRHDSFIPFDITSPHLQTSKLPCYRSHKPPPCSLLSTIYQPRQSPSPSPHSPPTSSHINKTKSSLLQCIEKITALLQQRGMTSARQRRRETFAICLSVSYSSSIRTMRRRYLRGLVVRLKLVRRDHAFKGIGRELKDLVGSSSYGVAWRELYRVGLMRTSSGRLIGDGCGRRARRDRRQSGKSSSMMTNHQGACVKSLSVQHR